MFAGVMGLPGVHYHYGNRRSIFMSIVVKWDTEEKSIVRYEVSGRWTWDEMYQAILEAHALADSVTYKVEAIVDMSNTRHVPGGASPHAKNMLGTTHPNMGRVVIVGAGTYLRLLLETFGRVAGQVGVSRQANAPDSGNEPIFARSLDEARDILTRVAE